MTFAVALGALSSFATAAVIGWPALSGQSTATWAAGALIALPLILIQTGAEEAVFRGYLLQQLAARFRSPFAWAVVPSLLFGALHWSPDAPGGGLSYVVVTATTGLVLALIAARLGGLSFVWGVHFGVNAWALLFVAPQGYLSGLARAWWLIPDETLSRLVWFDLVWVLLGALIAWIWLSGSPQDG
ncbi:MAG: CPBP family intramembrane glutamic endopeptidase [Pseudomonadota bacterium]